MSNHYDYGFRIYNPAIARFLSVDPLTSSYPWYTPYQFAGNKPIKFIDLDGAELFNPAAEYPTGITLIENITLPSRFIVEKHRAIEKGSYILHRVYSETGEYWIAAKNHNGGFEPIWVIGSESFFVFWKDTEKYEYLENARNMGLLLGGNNEGDLIEGYKDVLKNPVNWVTGAHIGFGSIEGSIASGMRNGPKVKTPSLTTKEISKLRRQAVKQAWKDEIRLIEKTGKGTRDWTRPEITELMETGKVKGYAGHHINDVKTHPELAGNPNNIEFLQTGNLKGGGSVKGSEHYLKHNTPEGKKIETTTGELLDRSGGG